MREYRISGVTFSGVKVDEAVNAYSLPSALRVILLKYNERLKKPYTIFLISTIEDISQLPDSRPLRPIDPLLSDDNVIRIGALLKANLFVTEEDKSRFIGYFHPMVRRAVSWLWTDASIATHEDKEQEMYSAIIAEFLPSFSPELGRLRRYIKLCVQRRLIRDWNQEKYINAGKTTARPKHELLEEYNRQLQARDIPLTDEGERQKLINACIRIIQEGTELTMNNRRGLFEWVVRTGLHRELIRYKKQVEALDLVYGTTSMTEIEAAITLGVSQQTLNKNKCRGEASLFKYIKKFFVDN
ncbi:MULTISPECIES: hypothetical protein [Paenibacillus]|uniref:Uncharacterized protein n=1 Tax=Paenibacillus rigui TaxID=554312 RepID=A0A229UUK5_9BACL|nr:MULTISPECIES: hypothetical protein [Paenibacillus]OXM87064.1 hypothetical protein CF651_07030 [Paenibacillus rigui]